MLLCQFNITTGSGPKSNVIFALLHNNRSLHAREKKIAEIDKRSIDKLDLLNWMMRTFQIKYLLLVKNLCGLTDGMEVIQDAASAQ